MTNLLSQLDSLYDTQRNAVDAWFDDAYLSRERPIYSSVDIRNAGFKSAPVDTNLFPAGFNNLTSSGRERAVDAFRHYVEGLEHNITRILIMSENHTRNRFYTDNLCAIVDICEKAGLETAVGRFDLNGNDTLEMVNSTGGIVQAESVHIEGTNIVTESGFKPDIIFVNNDLSSGCPQILCDAVQPVFPPPGMGWYRRRKSVHFSAYNQIASEFSSAFKLDPWLISTIIHHCGKINFKERKGLECVALGVDKTVHAIREKYAQYGIDRTPYVYVKADSGTYGMGVMVARSGDEIMEINKKNRNKMNVIKEGVQNSEVIIQEGVPTVDVSSGIVAEPVVYLVGGQPVGSVWRTNEGRTDETSLNASGMVFQPFDDTAFTAAGGIRLIGKLATVAASYEHYDHEPCPEKVA